jgi:hypothetical protein
VTVRTGKTRLVVSDRLGQVAGAIYGGVGGGVGGGTIILPILAGAAIAPVVIPIALAAWIGGTMLGCRALFKRSARTRAVRMQRIFNALLDQIENGITKP